MTKIQVYYVYGGHIHGGVYYVEDTPHAETYQLKDGCIQFCSTESHTLNTSWMIIPFNNIVSIQIWEESDEIDEGKN